MVLSVVMPAYNEELRIKGNLEDYARTFKDAEILVMIEGDDNTLKIVQELAKTYKNIAWQHSTKRIGKGKAIKQGCALAVGDLVGFADSDGSISAKEFKKLVENLADSDGIIASRRMPNSVIVEDRPISQRLGSTGLNLLSRFMFGLPFRDTQCGAKIFKKEVINDILGDIVITDFAFDINLLYSLKKHNCKIKEMGIEWTHMRGSKFNFQVLYWKIVPKLALSLLKLRFRF